jgi:predicted outer membrane repeat protein
MRPRSATFSLIDNVELYGGFLGQSHPSGGEGSRTARNPEQNETILSGNIDDPNDPTDNCQHVIYAYEVTSIVVNGFTIRDGYGDAFGLLGQGGGIHSWNSGLRVGRCVFRNNHAASGGAVKVTGINAQSPASLYVNCSFFDNTADDYGGAFSTHHGVYSLTNCVFVHNSAGKAGGGFGTVETLNFGHMINCTFTRNSASSIGGAVSM